jgi:hypothetical protein
MYGKKEEKMKKKLLRQAFKREINEELIECEFTACQ